MENKFRRKNFGSKNLIPSWETNFKEQTFGNQTSKKWEKGRGNKNFASPPRSFAPRGGVAPLVSQALAAAPPSHVLHRHGCRRLWGRCVAHLSAVGVSASGTVSSLASFTPPLSCGASRLLALHQKSIGSSGAKENPATKRKEREGKTKGLDRKR